MSAERIEATFGLIGGHIELIKKVTRKLEKQDIWKSMTNLALKFN